MAYGTVKKKSLTPNTTSTWRGKSLSELTREEKAERAREMNAANYNPDRKVRYNTKASGGVKGKVKEKPSASTAKPPKSYSSNPARAAKQKAREKGKELICGPTGCMTRKKAERLRSR
jgi:hypothetical protein